MVSDTVVEAFEIHIESDIENLIDIALDRHSDIDVKMEDHIDTVNLTV